MRVMIRIGICAAIFENEEGYIVDNNFVYPAYLKEDGGEKLLVFPDFEELVISVDNTSDFISDAQMELALVLIDYIDSGRKLPIRREIDQNAIYIHVWLPYFRTMTKEVYVKKTVTIPQWLDELAKNGNVNYSACLVKGIKMELGLK